MICKKKLFVVVICFLLVILTGFARGAETNKITFVYGNREKAVKTCLRGWGFTILIRYDGKNILFNTGGKESVLANNLKVLNIDIKKLDALVLSHEHWEYYQALGTVLKENPTLPVYLTNALSRMLSRKFPKANFKVVSDVTPITPNFLLMNLRSGRFQGGPFGIDEIHIILKTSEGLIIAEGCGHPQVLNVVQKSKTYTKENRVAMLMGGTWLHRRGTLYDIPDSGEKFHAIQMFQWSDDDYRKLAQSLREEGVKWIIPTHCTGEPAESIFKAVFGKYYINELLGMSMKLPSTKK